MSKLYAIYSIAETDERFLGQVYLTEKDLRVIEQNFAGQLKSEYHITLMDGEVVNIDIIDTIEEIKVDED